MATDLKVAEQFAKIYGYSGQSNGYSFGPSLLHDTDAYGVGSSIFHLVTYTNGSDGKPTYEIASGLLSELPEFSFNVRFNEGPGKSTQDIIQGLFDNELFKLINAVGSADGSFKNTIAVGSLTREMYGGVDAADIPLKFRIYSANPLGQTDAKAWKSLLTKYAVPNSSNSISIQNGIANIKSALNNAEGLGSDLVNIFFNSDDVGTNNSTNSNSIQSSSELQKSVNAQYTEGTNAILNYAFDIVSKINGVKEKLIDDFNAGQKANDVEHMKITNIYYNYEYVDAWDLTTGLNAATSLIGDMQGHKIRTLVYKIEHRNHQSNAKLTLTVPIYIPLYTENFDLIGQGDPDQDLQYLSEWCFQYSKDETTGDISISLNESKLSEQLTLATDRLKKSLNMKNDYKHVKTFINDLANAIKQATVDKYNDPVKEDRKKLEKSLSKVKSKITKIGTYADKIQKIGEKRFGFHRAAGELNRKNGLGEKLWELYIYNNFIFKKTEPLIVYIKDWEITESKECTELGPIYTDISITCSLDQDYSIDQWKQSLDPTKLGKISVL